MVSLLRFVHADIFKPGLVSTTKTHTTAGSPVCLFVETVRREVMSTASVVPREHTTNSTSSSISECSVASPTPPLVLTGKKTSPAKAKLSNSHASSETVFPLGPADVHRCSPVEAKSPVIIMSGSGGGSTGGAMECASGLLQNVQQEDDLVQKKRNRALFGGRSSPSFRASDKASVRNKRYVKMGILLPDLQPEVSTYRSHHIRNTGISSPSGGSLTPPPTLPGTSRELGMWVC